jgi:hypothetical protein
MATLYDLNITANTGMALAPPASYALRLGLRQTLGTVSLALSVFTFSFFLAGQPLAAGCSGYATIPFLLATIALVVASDLLLLPPSRNRRLRQSAIMNGLLLGVGLTLLAGVILSSKLAFPALYPLLFVVFSLPFAAPLNLGFVSRIRMEPGTWRLIITLCLLVATVCVVAGLIPYQDRIACQWTPS